MGDEGGAGRGGVGFPLWGVEGVGGGGAAQPKLSCLPPMSGSNLSSYKAAAAAQMGSVIDRSSDGERRHD